jgi:hypothetical protein
MPEKCRVGVCGFDPMLVRGYLKTGERALWWHMSDELFEENNVKPNTPVSGKILAVYDGEGKKTGSPNDAFNWKTSKESGLAVQQIQAHGIPFPGTPRGKDRRQGGLSGEGADELEMVARGENEARLQGGLYRVALECSACSIPLSWEAGRRARGISHDRRATSFAQRGCP